MVAETMIAFVALLVCCAVSEISAARKVHTIHWESRNPIFRLDNTDHIIDVNQGNIPFEYDQVNIVCPSFEEGSPARSAEQYIIYSVSKEEYDSCRITNPKPRIIAVCDRPDRLLYFTITFRSFTPQPGGLEFRPGQDYYFISTSSREDLHRRSGGHCKSHNMRVVFKVCCKNGSKSGDEHDDEMEDSNSVDFVGHPGLRTSGNRTTATSAVAANANADGGVAQQPQEQRQPSASGTDVGGGVRVPPPSFGYGNYQPPPPPPRKEEEEVAASDAGTRDGGFVGFRPYSRPRVAAAADDNDDDGVAARRPPAVWRPRWGDNPSSFQLSDRDDSDSDPASATRRPSSDSSSSWFVTSTSRSTSYKNFGFPVFSVKSRPPPKQTDYLYKLEKDLLRRQELLRSHSCRTEISTLLLTCSVLLVSWLRYSVG